MANINQQFASDVLRIMRLAIGRRNTNDPDSSDTTLIKYINDFMTLIMPDDVKLFEQYGTLIFEIDETSDTAVYNLEDIPDANLYQNFSNEAIISLLEPVGRSISWNYLPVYQDWGRFFALWGINNEDILIRGYPTNMLYYGNQFTFRTLPNTAYQVQIAGYKIHPEFSTPDDPLQYSNWFRYLAYGAARDYARDFRYESSVQAQINRSFASYRRLRLTDMHNQKKLSRCKPRF